MFENLDLGAVLTDSLRAVALLVPKVLVFLAIAAVGWIAARVVQKACGVVLERVGFDRAVERGGLRHFLGRTPYTARALVARLVFYAVMLIALQAAFGVFGPNPVSDMINTVVGWLPRAAVAIVIVVVAAAIARAAKDIVGTALGALPYGRVLGAVCSYFVLGLGGIAALNQIGVALTVTLPVLITVLATVGGILVVGAGGGLVKPMQQRWERWLSRAEDQSAEIAEHARAYAAGRTDTSTRYISAPMPVAQMPGAQMPGTQMPAPPTGVAHVPGPPGYAPSMAHAAQGHHLMAPPAPAAPLAPPAPPAPGLHMYAPPMPGSPATTQNTQPVAHASVPVSPRMTQSPHTGWPSIDDTSEHRLP